MEWLESKHALHILLSYGAGALILGLLVATTLIASARAKRRLAAVERGRER